MRILADGSMIEVGLVGFDGFVGVHSLAPTAEQPYRLIVQNSGAMHRLPLKQLRSEFARGGKLQDLLLRFISAFLTQISQTAACNRLHKIEERLARWLLMMRDRVPSDELNLTQEFLSQMLGIRLAGVNEAIRTRTMNGLVQHRRNLITILDREGLEAAACECYAFVRDEARRTFET
jgi:CRP-like cAMP-binding protein